VHNLQTTERQCPYCGEQIEILIDCSIDAQEYIEDCSVCCRPIIFSVVSSEGEIETIELRTEDD
jgi:Cysteine-rich CPXCG